MRAHSLRWRCFHAHRFRARAISSPPREEQWAGLKSSENKTHPSVFPNATCRSPSAIRLRALNKCLQEKEERVTHGICSLAAQVCIPLSDSNIRDVNHFCISSSWTWALLAARSAVSEWITVTELSLPAQKRHTQEFQALNVNINSQLTASAHLCKQKKEKFGVTINNCSSCAVARLCGWCWRAKLGVKVCEEAPEDVAWCVSMTALCHFFLKMILELYKPWKGSVFLLRQHNAALGWIIGGTKQGYGLQKRWASASLSVSVWALRQLGTNVLFMAHPKFLWELEREIQEPWLLFLTLNHGQISSCYT